MVELAIRFANSLQKALDSGVVSPAIFLSGLFAEG